MVSVPLRRAIAAALLVVALVVVGARHLAARGAAAPLLVPPVRARAAPVAAAALVVDVEGAVRRPGLVRLRAPARVADAVVRAGGFARGAERSAVNLAAPVADGQQVLVPHGGAAAAAGAVPAVSTAPAGPLSLSTATPEQLDALPGVGPVTAQKIVDYRTAHGSFHSVDELDAIPGIGPARLADLQGLVVP
jgi:competence protein ComEA